MKLWVFPVFALLFITTDTATAATATTATATAATATTLTATATTPTTPTPTATTATTPTAIATAVSTTVPRDPTSSMTEGTTTIGFCDNVADYKKCRKEYSCINGECLCENGKPFCRCNNSNNEWYLGEKCGQKWTVVQFALVASLPGLALALIVGVTVYFALSSAKLKHGPGDAESPKKESKIPQKSFGDSRYDSMYTNPVFASDFGNSRKSLGQTQEQISLNVPSQAHSYYSSQPSGTSQAYNNPYSKASKNPYDNEIEPPAKFDGYRRSTQNSITGGFQRASLSTSMYAAPDYSTRPQFPRAQIGRQY